MNERKIRSRKKRRQGRKSHSKSRNGQAKILPKKTNTLTTIASNFVREQLNINRLTSYELLSDDWGKQSRETFMVHKIMTREGLEPLRLRVEDIHHYATGAMYDHLSQPVSF